MAQELDDAAVLAYLKAKRTALDASIASMEAYLGNTASGEGVPQALKNTRPENGEPETLGPGTFHGMSVSEATKKYLEITKKKQKTRAICDALQHGGIETDAKNFYGNVYTTLQRTKDFIHLGKYWALAEWYPTRAAVQEKPAKKARRGKPKGRVAKAPKPSAASGDKPAAGSAET